MEEDHPTPSVPRRTLKQTDGERLRLVEAETAAMAAGLIHELSQPLSALATYIHSSRCLIEPSVASCGLLSETLEKAEAELQRTREVLVKLRECLAGERLERVPINLFDLTCAVVDLLQDQAAAKTVRIVVEAGSMPVLSANARQLKQLFLNLIQNAIDAACESPNGVVSVRCCHDTETVEVEVNDNGRGIPSEIAEHLFEPFQTTKRNGMGLGLPLSRQIVESHGGQLWWERVRPQGTCFHFRLPIDCHVQHHF